MSLLTLNNLQIGYDKNILTPINTTIQKGQLICLLGNNGSGKSTLLKTLLGIQMPISGDISYQNTPIIPSDRKKWASIFAAVLSKTIVPNHLKVYDMVALGRLPYKNWHQSLNNDDHKIIKQAIDLVDINHIQDNLCDELSDGQLQMVAIARAIAQDTPIICMDEPTSFLDLENKFKLFELVRSLPKVTGKTIIISTHEQEQALLFSDIVWYILADKLNLGYPEDVAYQCDIFKQSQKSNIAFNYKIGKFLPYNLSSEIAIDQNEPLKYWIEHALLRNNIPISSLQNITIINGQIILTNNSKTIVFSKIQELVEFLKK